MMWNDPARKYAPVLAMLIGITAGIAKTTSTRYLMEGEWKLKSSDLFVGVFLSVISYVMFRMRYGYRSEGSWYKR